VKVAVPTFEAAADACHKEGPPSRWQERHASAFIASLKQHAFPKLGRLLVDSIDENSIVAVLAPLWHDKPAAARKVRQRIRTVLDFAKVSGWRSTGAPNISPRASLGKQPRSGNFAAMPYADVPEFVATLRDKPTSAGRLALLFAILTAARSGEVRAARWSQIDLDARTWTRPAELMKSREPHIVTLPPAAVALLDEAKQLRTLSSADLVFPGANGRPLADMTLLKIVKADGGDFTVHGFRAAFRTWVAEQMPTVPEAVAEAALAHTVPDAVVRAYQRAKFMDLRRKLLDAWSAYCAGKQDNVIRLAS
jgi:integrase